jgi:pimeloyl-ACP methyl ester carboxylesterase
VAPYLRGYGKTTFLSPDTPRTAQQSDLAMDALHFLDALGLAQASVLGHDWGARAACGLAALYPTRVRSLTALTGYLLYDTEAGKKPAPPERENPLWYQWYFQTERGRRGLAEFRREIGERLWRQWSPSWRFSRWDFTRVAASWDTPDFVDVVIHSYRHRHGNAETNASLADIEAVLQQKPAITVPSVVLLGRQDPLQVPEDWRKQAHLWPRATRCLVMKKAGHFMHHEKPKAVVEAFLELERTLAPV